MEHDFGPAGRVVELKPAPTGERLVWNRSPADRGAGGAWSVYGFRGGPFRCWRGHDDGAVHYDDIDPTGVPSRTDRQGRCGHLVGLDPVHLDRQRAGAPPARCRSVGHCAHGGSRDRRRIRARRAVCRAT